MKDILEKAMEYVNKLLVPLEKHYYHQYCHSLKVMKRSMYLAKKEGLSDEEIEMMGLAGIFHDTGFTIKYDDNEEIGGKIAENFLKTMLYPEDKIKKINEIILATKPSYKNPKNIYEEIIKDADMDNLGREDFLEYADKVKRELEEVKKIKQIEPDWTHGLIKILREHTFFTKTQRKEREERRLKNLKEIEKRK